MSELFSFNSQSDVALFMQIMDWQYTTLSLATSAVGIHMTGAEIFDAAMRIRQNVIGNRAIIDRQQYREIVAATIAEAALHTEMLGVNQCSA